MKKVLLIGLCLLVMTVLLTACGAGPVGKFTTKSVDGMPVAEYIEEMGATPEMLEIGSAEELMTLDIREDGTFTATMSGADPKEGTWKQEGGKVELTADGVTEEFTLSGDELAYKVDDTDLVLVKTKE